MSASWLDELLPQAMVSARSKIWWLLFFLLFPLAYVGGVYLEVAEETPARIANAQDRAESIEIAERFAASKGFAVRGWRRYAVATTDANLLAYYGDARQPDLQAASNMAPAREVLVLFRSADLQEFRIHLSLTGKVTGYESGKSLSGENGHTKIGILQVNNTTPAVSNDEPPDAAQKAESEAVARRELASNVALSNLVKRGEAQLGGATISTNSDDRTRVNVAWDTALANRPGLSFHITVGVRDHQVVADRIEASISKEHVLRKSQTPVFLNVAYGSFMSFAAFYAMFRYAKRTLQKEVSHVRTLIVAGLFLISYTTHAYSRAFDLFAINVSRETFTKAILVSCIFSVVVFAIMGLLVGLGYGSGEGEVREAYPGKLTSLDALLAGRIFSRDVAASLLFGMAAAGWLLLGHHLLGYFFRTNVVDSRSDVLNYTYARLPWLTILVGKQYDSLLTAVAGLLLPASFLLRSNKRKKPRFTWLIVFALCSVLNDAASYSTIPAAVLAMIVFAGALLLPFFAFDLLAAMVSFSALSYANELARLAAVFPSWTGFAVSLAALAAASLVLATYLARRGRRVREEDVRPLYARNLAERMSMQAEVLAAREAQLRLLPQNSPEIPGIEIAACCLPARGVGGDFYDFFKLDSNRLGIFVAQGGDQGLASALCIALAKGVLMHMSLQPHSPTQIVVQLEASIAELLEGDSGRSISFAYGVLDARRNILNYARIGSSPHLVVHHPGSGLTSAAQLERVVNLPARLKSAQPVYEGAVHTQVGDLVIFFTDGVTSLRSRRFGKREYQWLDLLTRQINRPDEQFESSLTSALAKYQSNASSDLTAVVLRIIESQAIAQEVVA